jgi:type VI secretion system secreted protein Hcp
MPAYLKYGDIRGDVKEPAHKSWIELESVQWQTHQTHSNRPTPREPAKTNIDQIVVTKLQDSASVLLYKEALSGKEVEAFIDLVGSDGSVYLRVEMKGTLISAYNVSAGGANPMESLTLNFNEVKFTHTPGTPPPKY